MNVITNVIAKICSAIDCTQSDIVKIVLMKKTSIKKLL